jgi:hypothetical protein
MIGLFAMSRQFPPQYYLHVEELVLVHFPPLHYVNCTAQIHESAVNLQQEIHFLPIHVGTARSDEPGLGVA